jgi:thymidine kinase
MDITQAHPGAGWIEVIAGSMFSGKSEELIRRLRRAQIAKRKVQIFKPKIDNRYGDDHITSHSDMRIPSENLSHLREHRRGGARAVLREGPAPAAGAGEPGLCEDA